MDLLWKAYLWSEMLRSKYVHSCRYSPKLLNVGCRRKGHNLLEDRRGTSSKSRSCNSFANRIDNPQICCKWRVRCNIRTFYHPLFISFFYKFLYLVQSLSYFEYLMEQDYLDTKQCRLGLAKERFYQPGLEGLVLRKDSPLATIFTKKYLGRYAQYALYHTELYVLLNFRILEVMQSGLDHYWRLKDRRKISATENCKTPDASQREPVLTLRTLQDSFLILAVGLGLASVAFVVEIVHHKIWTSRIRSNRTV